LIITLQHSKINSQLIIIIITPLSRLVHNFPTQDYGIHYEYYSS